MTRASTVSKSYRETYVTEAPLTLGRLANSNEALFLCFVQFFCVLLTAATCCEAVSSYALKKKKRSLVLFGGFACCLALSSVRAACLLSVCLLACLNTPNALKHGGGCHWVPYRPSWITSGLV